jgi:hypothetical protein
MISVHPCKYESYPSQYFVNIVLSVYILIRKHIIFVNEISYVVAPKGIELREWKLS